MNAQCFSNTVDVNLRAIESELLNRLPAAARTAGMRRILAALSPSENAALLTERCAAARSWLYAPQSAAA